MLIVDSHNDLNVYKTAETNQKSGQCCGGEASNACGDQQDSRVGHGLEAPESEAGQIDFNEWTGACSGFLQHLVGC